MKHMREEEVAICVNGKRKAEYWQGTTDRPE